MVIIRNRNANNDDIFTISNFDSAIAMETENKQLDSVTANRGVEAVFNDDQLGFYLIDENDGIPIVQSLITKECSDWRNGELWWIQSVYIHVDYRKNNVYRKLYNGVINLANNSKKVYGVRIYVDKDNTIAQTVYSKLGMVELNYVFFEEDWSDV